AGRLRPAELLERIDACSKLSPPRAEVPGVDRAALDVYAQGRTPLTGPILDSLPRVEDVGRRLFGTPPPVRFVLFSDLPRFQRFYALFGGAAARSPESAHSTGVVGLVVFSAQKARRATAAETVSLALHETMHAWAATYLREKYDRPIVLPPYVDEGLATYVAGLSSPEAAALPARRLELWRRRGFAPPPLAALRRRDSFYAPGRSSADYFISEQLIERLIGPPEEGAGKVRAFLDAYARTGDDLKAWRAVSGKDAAAEYAELAAGE
ncbi:MAG: hypothetical protein KGL53_06185, partial [Elusimicrobia bacterium]|nr:hypothetical protein [Elusimicrobiota bacterium]